MKTTDKSNAPVVIAYIPDGKGGYIDFDTMPDSDKQAFRDRVRTQVENHYTINNVLAKSRKAQITAGLSENVRELINILS